MRIEAARARVASRGFDCAMSADLRYEEQIIAVSDQVAQAGVAKNLRGNVQVSFVADLSDDKIYAYSRDAFALGIEEECALCRFAEFLVTIDQPLYESAACHRI